MEISLGHTLPHYTNTHHLMLKSNMHSSLYSLELDNMHKNYDIVKILTCLMILHTYTLPFKR